MISLVIPVYNEEESLKLLYEEITAVAAQEDLTVEVVFVDDGSKDGSWALIGELARQNDNVRGIRFRRNFGKAAALSAGFRAAHGDIILTLDAEVAPEADAADVVVLSCQ